MNTNVIKFLGFDKFGPLWAWRIEEVAITEAACGLEKQRCGIL
jgi:hypothetical protein